MSSKMRVRTRWFVVAAVLALAQSASVAVQAQFFWSQQDQHNRQRSRPQSVGLFDWFGGGLFSSRPREDDSYRLPRQRQQPSQHTQQEPSESSRAPPPRKKAAKHEHDGAT